MILQDLLINLLFLVGVVFLQVLGSLALMGIEKAGVLTSSMRVLMRCS